MWENAVIVLQWLSLPIKSFHHVCKIGKVLPQSYTIFFAENINQLLNMYIQRNIDEPAAV